MLKVKVFTVNWFDENTYVLSDPDAGECVVVDPGMVSDDERRAVDDYISSQGLCLTQVVNTHLHLDHCFGIPYLREKYGVRLGASADDGFLGADIKGQAERFGIRVPVSDVSVDIPLRDGDTVRVGGESLRVIAVPGHSPGGLALYSASASLVLTGDSLFRRSIGRTDLPGGNHLHLMNSVRERLLTLPGDTVVLPGHGPATTVAEERIDNPFVS